MAYHNGDGRVLDRNRDVAHVPGDGGASIVSLFTSRRSQGPASAHARSACPELDCLGGRLPHAVLVWAERQAIKVGVGADRMLITAGYISEEAYIEALTRWLGLEFETFEHRTRQSCPLDDRHLMTAARESLLPLIVDGTHAFVCAPRSVREFLAYAKDHPNVRFRLTSAARLNAYICRCGFAALGYQAADALNIASPELSAGARNHGRRFVLAAMAAFAIGITIAAPAAASLVAGAFFTIVFSCWLMLRLIGSCLRQPLQHSTRIPDRELPVYTIIVALYREAETVEELVRSLRRLRSSFG